MHKFLSDQTSSMPVPAVLLLTIIALGVAMTQFSARDAMMLSGFEAECAQPGCIASDVDGGSVVFLKAGD